MKAYLIQFHHEVYCQGWEYITGMRLVRAESYAEAVERIKKDSNINNAMRFVNLTME